MHIYCTRGEFALIRKKQTAKRTETRGSTDTEEIRVAGTREAIDKAMQNDEIGRNNAELAENPKISLYVQVSRNCCSATLLQRRISFAVNKRKTTGGGVR